LLKGDYFRRSPDFVKVEGASAPWLYTFGVCGLSKLTIPLVSDEDGAARYTVRLGFAEMDDAKPGQRVFSVTLQNKPALKDFDVVKEAGGARRAMVKEFTGVEVNDKLTIALVPKVKKLPLPVQMPILQTVEIVREKVLAMGVTMPSFELSDSAPEQQAEARIGNFVDGDFEGTLVVSAPDGFSMTPEKADIRVLSGSRAKLSLHASVTQKMPPGRYPVTLRLERKDGRVECEKQCQIDYLGPRSRLVIKASADADVGPGVPIAGASPSLFVDGGDQQMGDDAYRMAYFKFKVALPGRPVSVKLRIWNAGNPTSDGGNVCLVTGRWNENTIAYENRPQPGAVLAHLGPVVENQLLEVPLKVSLDGLKELSLAIVPVNTDGVDYISRKGLKPPELVVDCEP
jgi:hypothetical protein